MKDELEYRRAGFKDSKPPGVNVVLGDGQAWCLPRPLIRWTLGEDEIVEPFIKFGDRKAPREYASLLKAYEEAENGFPHMTAALRLGKALLTTYYDLTAAEVAELLQFNWDDADPEGTRIKDEVMAVATGRGDAGPKP